MAEKLTHRLWKKVVDVHRRNREYYGVYIQRTREGFLLFAEKKRTRICSDLKLIQKNRRFARIVFIDDQTNWDPLWEGAKAFGEVEAVKQLKSVAPQFEQSSWFVARDLRSQDIMMSALGNKLFGGIELVYDERTSLTFLEQQITKSPFLEMIQLSGNRWPQSVLPVLEKLYLKERPGRHVHLELLDSIKAENYIKFLENIFNHWKGNGTLNFSLGCYAKIVNPKARQTLLRRNEVTKLEPDKFRSVLRCETTKSIALCESNNYYHLLEFRTCECDVSKECYLKEQYPKYHNF
uniref:FTH domain-containing protein n=1 Tax=Steinernema glaseri TaxID=37863 RepID=A0A1I7YLE7_9BILA